MKRFITRWILEVFAYVVAIVLLMLLPSENPVTFIAIVIVIVLIVISAAVVFSEEEAALARYLEDSNDRVTFDKRSMQFDTNNDEAALRVEVAKAIKLQPITESPNIENTLNDTDEDLDVESINFAYYVVVDTGIIDYMYLLNDDYKDTIKLVPTNSSKHYNRLKEYFIPIGTYEALIKLAAANGYTP